MSLVNTFTRHRKSEADTEDGVRIACKDRPSDGEPLVAPAADGVMGALEAWSIGQGG